MSSFYSYTNDLLLRYKIKIISALKTGNLDIKLWDNVYNHKIKTFILDEKLINFFGFSLN